MPISNPRCNTTPLPWNSPDSTAGAPPARSNSVQAPCVGPALNFGTGDVEPVAPDTPASPGIDVIAYTKGFSGSNIGPNAFYRAKIVPGQSLATTLWAAQGGNGQFDSLGGQSQSFQAQNLSYDSGRDRFHFTSGTGIIGIYNGSDGSFVKGWRPNGSEWDGVAYNVGSTLSRYGGHTYDATANALVAIDGSGSPGVQANRVDLGTLTLTRQDTGIVQFYPANAVYDGSDYVYTRAPNSGGQFRGHSFQGNLNRVFSITGWQHVLFYCKTYDRLVCMASVVSEPASHNVILVDPSSGTKTGGITATSGQQWEIGRVQGFARLSDTRFVVNRPYVVFEITDDSTLVEQYDWESLIPGGETENLVVTAVDANRFLVGVNNNVTGSVHNNIYLIDVSTETATYMGSASSIAGENPSAGGTDDDFEMLVTSNVAV